MTDSEIGLAIRLTDMIWQSPDLRIHAPAAWLESLYVKGKCVGRYEGAWACNVFTIIQGSRAFWWHEKDEVLYSPYVMELIGRPKKRESIPSWMKALPREDARRAGDPGQEYLACYYCEDDVGGNYHFDHDLPLCRGGINHPSNLRIACPACNFAKGTQTGREFTAANPLPMWKDRPK